MNCACRFASTKKELNKNEANPTGFYGTPNPESIFLDITQINFFNSHYLYAIGFKMLTGV
jgi:hypothetical protein